jgi:sulfotransferase family protein
LIFYSVRNPISRAWSHAMMELRIGRLAGIPYSEAVVEDFLKSSSVRSRSDHVTTISNWRNVFSPEQLHIIVFDDIIAQPRAVFATLCRHLGVDPAVPTSAEIEFAKPVFAGLGWDVPGRLLDLLRAQYRPLIERIPELIGRDVSHWLEWDGRRSSADGRTLVAKPGSG